MLGRTTGAVLLGVDARIIEVEVDLGGGLPTISAVGLPDSAIREGIERIRTALPNALFELPQRKVIVNLAPAGVRKQGPALDLPMMECVILETPADDGPFGLRGVGEPPIIPPAAALSNAVYDATGARITELPMSPERVFWAMKNVSNGA